MPLSDQAKITTAYQRPRIVKLWQALISLQTTVSFMNTGAHPDDETSAMLAALRFRDGIDISYACSTRGEGGQNDIGTESSAALGTLRTAEMESACDRLDLRMYWHSVSPEDTIFDFGFSKSGKETLGKWGKARILARFVEIIRIERPDIICPTFLDVPGQHGHHRAMTEAAHLVMDLAADPKFEGSDLPPWQVKKMYLPAWSGAGQAYDDDLPPPPATLIIPAKGRDPVTGWSFARIGQQSRVMHATQGMGRWIAPGSETDFPLHLAHSFVPGPDQYLCSGLVKTLRGIDLPGAAAAQEACDAALAAFPDSGKIVTHANVALSLIRQMQNKCTPEYQVEIGHKLSRKAEQLSQVIHLAAGVDVRATLDRDVLHPGDQVEWAAERVTEHGTLSLSPALPEGWSSGGSSISLSPGAAVFDPYPDTYLPGQPAAPRMDVSLTLDGVTSTVGVPFDVAPIVVPKYSATVSPRADVMNCADQRRRFEVDVSHISPTGAVPGLEVPDGWRVAESDAVLTVTAPEGVVPGLYDLALTLDGHAASSVQHINRDHISPRALITPAMTQLRVVDVALPDVKIGYIGGGNDRVALWLDRLGCTLTDLSDSPLTDAVLAEFDTLVIGIFAMKSRPGLDKAMPRIHDWARAGGTLVTLYHRPWDNWDPATTAPYPLEIGQPSLRWRVTDENAVITPLVSDHPILNHPNQIGDADWADWHKERGLYFAKSWDPAYTPLIAMHDPEEQPLEGGLLVADVGKGRHVHTSLILHHQMEKLTPGGFSIMANLLAKRG